MQRGSLLIGFGLALILAGVLGLKLTDLNVYWAGIAAGAAIGAFGGISISQRARP
jgi:hypothetical protein